MMHRYAFIPLFGLFMVPAQTLDAATPGAPALTPVTVGNVSYLIGGVGDEEELAMQGVAGDYPLLVAFTEKEGGKYIAGVQVTLKDRTGKTLVDVQSDGPCFFAKLRPGRYSLLASYHGQTQKRSVDIKEHGRSAMVLRWAGPKGPTAAEPAPEAHHLARGCWR